MGKRTKRLKGEVTELRADLDRLRAALAEQVTTKRIVVTDVYPCNAVVTITPGIVTVDGADHDGLGVQLAAGDGEASVLVGDVEDHRQILLCVTAAFDDEPRTARIEINDIELPVPELVR